MTLRFTRREMLKLSAAASLAPLIPFDMHAQSSAQLQRAIPKSGEKIPAVGLGTSRTFDVKGNASALADCKEVLRIFREQGGKVVDSSPMYGSSEEVIGDLSSDLGIGQQLFMATKVWTTGKQQGISQMQDSLGKMKVKRMDLMQVHNLQDLKTHLATLRDWKKQGTIRYIGVTHFNEGAHAALEDVLKTEELDFIQFNYSLSEREAEERLLPLAADKGVAVMINRPFARSSMFGKVGGKALPEWAKEFDAQSWAQFFLKYILGHPAVTVVIPATSNPKHMVDNMGAGRGKLPDAAMRRRMVEHFESL